MKEHKPYGDREYEPHILTGSRDPRMSWKEATDTKLDWRDIRVLDNQSLFEVLDAKRKTFQERKDFINDQDSTAGPGVINNMIRNILTVRSKTFKSDTRFGIKVDSLIFETLDWANLEFARTIIMQDLHNQLPSNINVTHIDLTTSDTWDTLYINIAYNIRIRDGQNTWQEPGPETIGQREAYVTLNLADSAGSPGHYGYYNSQRGSNRQQYTPQPQH